MSEHGFFGLFGTTDKLKYVNRQSCTVSLERETENTLNSINVSYLGAENT